MRGGGGGGGEGGEGGGGPPGRRRPPHPRAHRPAGRRRVYDAKDACEFAMRGIREGLDDETICQNLVRARVNPVPAARIDTMRKHSRRVCIFIVFLLLRESLDDETVRRNLVRTSVIAAPVHCFVVIARGRGRRDRLSAWRESGGGRKPNNSNQYY